MPPIAASALAALAALPLLRTGTWLVGTDSHDVTGGNDDGFSAAYSYLYKDGNEYVLFEEHGPGCIYEVRTIGFKGNLKVYLDGSETPQHVLAFQDLYSGKVQPFIHPFVASEEGAHGASWCYIPIGYNRGCRLATDELEPPKFFNIFAHKFPQGTEMPAFDPGMSLEEAARLWWGPDAYLSGAAHLKTLKNRVVLKPRQAARLAEIEGEGAIIRLRMRFLDGRTEQVANLVLRGYWDGNVSPQVSSPVSSFFGLGCPRAIMAKGFAVNTPQEGVKYRAGVSSARSIPVGEGRDGWLYCNFPMPYWKSAIVEILNASASDEVQFEYSIEYSEEPYPPESGYFWAQWREERPLRPGEDYCVINTRGRGHYVGCALTLSSWNGASPGGTKISREYLEGDARFYVDDIGTPVVAGTGTEEYFNWGWYSVLRHDAPFSYPTHGYPLHLVDTEDHSVMYRFHLSDLVPYYRSFRFDLEHGPVGRTTAHYSGTAFYYQRESPRLVLTDELNVCDRESESAHMYICRGGVSEVERTLPYEGAYQRPPSHDMPTDRAHTVKDAGRVWENACEFTVRIHRENAGVKLRRRSYYGFGAEGELRGERKHPILVPAQRVRVDVDGKTVGSWSLPQRHARATWLDTDFEIPARATSEKDQIRITLSAERGSLWDEYTYWVYSYLPAADERAEARTRGS